MMNSASMDMTNPLSPRTAATLEDAPLDGQTIVHEGQYFTTVKEGLAHILVPDSSKKSHDTKSGKDGRSTSQSVFYNPIQQFNRDLSVLAIRAYGEDLLAYKQQKVELKGSRGKKRKRNSPSEALANSVRGDAKAGTVDKGPGSEANANVSVQGGISETNMSSDHEQGPAPGTRTNGTSSHEVQNKGSRRFRILDALSATGLRALRYSHEIPFVTAVTANDLSRQATDSIKLNVTHNKLNDKITTVTGNAMSHMYSLISHPNKDPQNIPKYDVIDLDPYGTAAPFLDGAVQAITDGGLLCVTCTDAGVWASCGYPEKTYSLYGGTPLKGLHSHEGGLRLILHAIASSAARYGMSIEPLLSLSIDFYARVFVRVFRSPLEVKMLAGKTMLVYNCDYGCGAWKAQFLARNQTIEAKDGSKAYKHTNAQGPTGSTYCEHCGMKTHMSGPMWGGPIHNTAFIQTILEQLPTLDKSTYATTDRLEGMLTTALEETLLSDYQGSHKAGENATASAKVNRLIPRTDPIEVDRNPFFFVPSALSKVLHCRAPSEAEVRGALKHAGYMATRSHARPGTIKTNAPWSFIWDMMREWMRQKSPVKEGAIKPGTAGWGILHGGQNRPIPPKDSLLPSDSNISQDEVIKATNDSGAISIDAIIPDSDDPQSKPVIFDEVLGKETNKRRLKRYQENPRPNWGPMNRAKTSGGQKTSIPNCRT